MKLPKLEDYPNLEAIYKGTIAGEFRDWIAVRPELRKFIAELEKYDQEMDRRRGLTKKPNVDDVE